MNAKYVKTVAIIAVAIAVVVIFRDLAAYLLRLLVTAWIVALTLEPLCDKFAKRLPRGVSAWLALMVVAVGLSLIAVALVPSLVVQTREVIELLPSIMSSANGIIGELNQKLKLMGAGEISAGGFDLAGWAVGALSGAISQAGSVVSVVSGFFLGVILGVFILIDIDEARLRLETLVPVKWREQAIRMARDISTGLGMYLKGQITVSAIVGAISALALWLTGVKSPVALGAIVGIFNIIPYFGPIFGGVPAVLIALSQSLVTALFTVLALFLVQQIDSMVISPRVMSGATGLKPSTTIIAMSLGGAGWGPLGMLLALPVAISLKIALRTWASRND